MGQPLRKMPADWEPETAPDPFRYGWRWHTVRLPGGEVLDEQVPLTADDLLDPQPGDQVDQSQLHWELLFLLARILDRFYEIRDDVTLAVDLKMLWRIPGLKEPSPDMAVIPGVRRKVDPARTSFDVVEEGVRPCLILEVVSATDPEIRRNDYEKKVKIYQQVGVPEYVILDPPTPVTGGRLLLLGYRLDRNDQYRPIQPDAQGRLLSETTNLLFGVGEDGRTPVIFNAQTGERLLDPKEQADRAEEKAAREVEARKIEATARLAAEARADREAEARKAAEAEIARLRDELRKAGL
ncbi:MAG TPA: Uma2 family endonuclease [Thermoanaerobaculia bacterium]|nr:Uma2 family endonuclease [Thermoanaerobaculia bacterium]